MMFTKLVFHAIKDTRFWKFLLSFFLVAAAQPDISPFACMATACVGYALVWWSLEGLNVKRKFFTALFWMMALQMIHLSWMTSSAYTGYGILLGWIVHTFSVGLIFGGLSLAIGRLSPLACAGLWVWLEWLRPTLYFGMGFSWDPLGLALTAYRWPLQCASLAGILGLGFWIVYTNLLIYHKKRWGLLCAVLPYLCGAFLYTLHMRGQKEAPHLQALLVQLGESPYQREDHLWQQLFEVTAPYQHKAYDLIAFPEGGLPHAAQSAYIPIEAMRLLMDKTWGSAGLPVTPDRYLTNEEMGHLLAVQWQAPVVIGMTDIRNQRIYNGALCFSPDTSLSYYHKRRLLAFGEYLPWCFRWVRGLLPIDPGFSRGETPLCLATTPPCAVAICYEETVGEIHRQARREGAYYLLGLTNDVWYPRSRLPLSHFHHARVRTVELGMPMVRACTTGVTCALNSVGDSVAALPYETRYRPPQPGALEVSLPLYRYPTLYLLWGDRALLIFTAGALLCSFLLKKKRLGKVPIFRGTK